jgi:hypothetical protein
MLVKPIVSRLESNSGFKPKAENEVSLKGTSFGYTKKEAPIIVIFAQTTNEYWINFIQV